MLSASASGAPMTDGQPAHYDTADFVMLRAPRLPLDRLKRLREEDPLELAGRSDVSAAIACSSPALGLALERHQCGLLSEKEIRRLRSSIVRYLIRMSSRATPFGMLAGCSVVGVGNRTSVTRMPSRDHYRFRPDMAWLYDFVHAAEGSPEIIRGCVLYANPLIRESNGRIHLAGGAAALAGKQADANIRITPIVRDVMSLSARGIRFQTLVESLVDLNPKRSADKVIDLLTRLVALGFVSTDLRPPLASEITPVRYVAERLETIAPGSTERADLLEVIGLLDDASGSDSSAMTARIREITKGLANPEPSRRPAFQVDMSLGSLGTVGAVVGQETARAALLLLRMSTQPQGMSMTAGYRSAFAKRYGTHRWVPLLDLIDPSEGLGPMDGKHADPGRMAQGWMERRNGLLMDMAVNALKRDEKVVALDDETVEQLTHPQFANARLPVSLDLSVLVAAETNDDIDRGDFKLVVGPNVGSWMAGKWFGRFSSLSPSDGLQSRLAELADKEASMLGAEVLAAEIDYRPTEARLANVAIRPLVREAKLDIGVSPVCEQCTQLSLADLAVGIIDNRLTVKQVSSGKIIRFVTGHMLNDRTAPSVVQFLLRASNDGLVALSAWQWGWAENFPRLPRVEVGRIVLRLAEWRYAKRSTEVDISALRSWLAEWDVPRMVLLSRGDNRLMIDLASEEQFEEVVAELTAIPVGSTMVMQEAFPGPEHAWLKDSDGARWTSELVFPLVLNAPRPEADEAEASGVQIYERSDRTVFPGRSWAYCKLYGPRDRQNDVIGAIELLTEQLGAAALANDWFFIRYADPDPHIRLRFRTEEGRSGQLFEVVALWAAELFDRKLLSSLSFDTYDREIERYGGIEGLGVCEAIFCADSAFALGVAPILVTAAGQDEGVRMGLTALSVDRLLADIGMSHAERIEWYGAHEGPNSIANGKAYRKHKQVLIESLADSGKGLGLIGGADQIRDAIAERTARIESLGKELAALETAGFLRISVGEIAHSLTHLAVNRLGTVEHEATIYGVLKRSLISQRFTRPNPQNN